MAPELGGASGVNTKQNLVRRQLLLLKLFNLVKKKGQLVKKTVLDSQHDEKHPFQNGKF